MCGHKRKGLLHFQEDFLLDDELRETFGAELPRFSQQLYQAIASYFYRA